MGHVVISTSFLCISNSPHPASPHKGGVGVHRGEAAGEGGPQEEEAADAGGCEQCGRFETLGSTM